MAPAAIARARQAAGWRVEELPEKDIPAFMALYHCVALNRLSWAEAAQLDLQIYVNSHEECPLGHTYYTIQCSMANPGRNSNWRRQWSVARRLCHVREQLHNPLKERMGVAYELHFTCVHFPMRGGWPGTSSRLSEWLGVLGGLMRHGALSPENVCLVLMFLEAPALAEVGQGASRDAAPASQIVDAPAGVEEADASASPIVDAPVGVEEAATVVPDGAGAVEPT